MTLYLITKWFGCFVLDENHKIVDKKLFPKDAKEIVDRLAKIEKGEILNEEKDIAQNLKDFLVYDKRLVKIRGGISKERHISEYILECRNFGYDRDLLHTALLELAHNQLGERIYEDEDIIQAVNVIEEIDKTKNIFLERLSEWYGYHFPTASAEVEEIGDKLMQSAELNEDERSSMGKISNLISELDKTGKHAEQYLTKKMDIIAPNIAYIAGHLLGAKIIASANGLHNLSALPASTIQLLGAERSLFKALRHKGKTPKHGIIFQHPKVHQAPFKERGRSARILANQIAIAARADYYTKKFIADKLK